MKKKFTWLLLLAVLSSSVPLMAQNFAISLDGATNSVTTTAQIVPAGADFTVEFWAYVASLDGAVHEFVSQGTVGSGAFYIGYDATGQIRVGDAWTATGAQIPLGSWFHLAVTYFNATTTANVYINDVIKATNAAYTGFTAGGQNFAIGRQTNGAELLLGRMDELNVWSVARTQASIKGSMLRGLSNMDPTWTNVIAYYPMNEGSGTALNNISNTSGLNGTINGTVSGSTWASSPIQYGLNALAFDGVNNNVAVPPNALWDGLSSATIEMNVNPSASLSGNGDILGVRGPGPTGIKFSLHMSPSALGLFNGSSFTFGAVTFISTPGTWYHVSFVVDGVQDTTGVFVDGAYIGQIGQAFGTNTGAPLVMGVDSNSGSNAEPFAGSLDEVRIWNTKLTQAQIQTMMGQGLLGSEANLVALWNFDEGNAGGNNQFLNTAFDQTSSNNHGNLSGFSLSGTTSNFVTGSTITPLPVNFVGFTAYAQGKEVVLKWQTGQEENSRDFTIERSPTGASNSFTSIGTVPAAGHSSTTLSYSSEDVSPLVGKNYYRLLETDLDGHIMYSPLQLVTFGGGAAKDHFTRIGVNSIQIDFVQGNNNNYIVTDILGRTIQQGQMSLGRIYLNNVPMGVYVVKMISPNGAQRSLKVLVN